MLLTLITVRLSILCSAVSSYRLSKVVTFTKISMGSAKEGRNDLRILYFANLYTYIFFYWRCDPTRVMAS
jgi:hypothetical protein